MTHKTEISLKVPNLENLCCINCSIMPSYKQDSIIKSKFHSQVLTCRVIICSVRCCIASPSIQNVGDSIHVVIHKTFLQNGNLQEHLRRLNIKFSDPEEVHQNIYEACLNYTFTFKIAPYWNLIGQSVYLQGSNFLPFPPAIHAMDWTVHYKNDNTKLVLKPLKLNIQTLSLALLKIPPNILDNFISNANGTIDTINLTLFPCPLVYVLPKLTRARLLSVSRLLPKQCPFDTYNDLRRHWKNMYSYRLPKTSDGMLFYEVAFPSYPNESYVYPEACLLFKKPEFLTCENKNEIASSFLKDLARNVRAVCGEVIHIGQICPTLSIEYSYSIKNKYRGEYQEIVNKYRSPFFKHPNECIIIPPENTPNLCSVITVNGMDKMKTPMRMHTQKILSIMDNSKWNKKSMGKNSQCEILRTQGYTQDDLGLLKTDKPTVIDNMEDILSYNDIPSMHKKKKFKNATITNKNMYTPKANSYSEEVFETTQSQGHYLSQPSCSKPRIKNVRSVNLELSTIKNIRTRFESNKQNDQIENVETHKLKSIIVNTPLKLSNSTDNIPNSFEKIKKAFNSNENNKPHCDGYRKFNFQSDIESYNGSQTHKCKSILKNKVNTKETLQVKEDFKMELTDDLRRELVEFDDYNLNTKKNNNKDSILLELAKNENQELLRSRSENWSDKNFKSDDATQTSQKSKFDELQKKMFSSANFSSSSNFATLSSDQKSSFNYRTIDHGKFMELLNQEKSPKINDSCKNDSDDEDKLVCSPSIFKAVSKYFDSPEDGNQIQCNDLNRSIKTYSDVELQEQVSTVDHHSDNLSSNRNERNSYCTSPISSENTNMFENFLNRKLLPICNTPIPKVEKAEPIENSISKHFENNTDNVFKSQQNSSSTFEKYESQSKMSLELSQSIKNQQHNKGVQYTESVKSTELQGLSSTMEVDTSDFLSILSQSSNESESQKYESYKQAYTEALSLN